jgi:hypothetical protein
VCISTYPFPEAFFYEILIYQLSADQHCICWISHNQDSLIRQREITGITFKFLNCCIVLCFFCCLCMNSFIHLVIISPINEISDHMLHAQKLEILFVNDRVYIYLSISWSFLLWNINIPVIIETLVNFFALKGLSIPIQSDWGQKWCWWYFRLALATTWHTSASLWPEDIGNMCVPSITMLTNTVYAEFHTTKIVL